MSWIKKLVRTTNSEFEEQKRSEAAKAWAEVQENAQQFAALTPMVAPLLKEVGDACFGRFLCFAKYKTTFTKGGNGCFTGYSWRIWCENSSYEQLTFRIELTRMDKDLWFWVSFGEGKSCEASSTARTLTEAELRKAVEEILPNFVKWLKNPISSSSYSPWTDGKRVIYDTDGKVVGYEDP